MDSEKVISAPVSDTNSLEHGSSTDKKQEHITVDVDVDDNMDSRSELEANAFLDNKFPFPPLKGQLPEDRILTFRALFVGSALGAVISASNLYLGLKTGWTFSASLFGAILGFSIIKSVSKVLPNAWGGGHFGPKENVTVQTAATASGGLSIIFVTAIPGMYRLGLMGASPKDDMGKLITLTLVTAYYGLFFAIGLRKFYVLKLKLIFPTPTATAYTIRALHAGGAAAEAAGRKKAIVLAVFFAGAAVFTVLSKYAPGILWDHHVFWWLYTWGWDGIIAAENWGWWFEYTPAFIGAGMLSGSNASFSFFGGTVLAFALVGPLTVKYGETFGTAIDPDAFPGYMSYMSLVTKDPINKPSPRYWMLWIGVMVMLCSSFAEVACNGPILYRGAKRAFFEAAEKIPKTRAFAEKHLVEDGEEIDDPSPKNEQVPTWVWVTGLLTSIAVTMIVLDLQYDVNPGMTILAVILAFIFSFVAAQSAGATDINPVGTVSKASQLIFGGVTQGEGIYGGAAQKINLIAGVVTGGAAAQSVDLLGDLRTGYLLSAAPYTQFIAQGVGSFFAIFLSAGFFVLYTNAYPCILDTELPGTCQFPAPSIASWVAVANAVTSKNFPVPHNSAIVALILGIFSAIVVLVRYLWIPQKYWVYVPNMNAIGLAFTMTGTVYGTAMAVGAIISMIWQKKWSRNWGDYCYSVAAGLCAGEGIGGLILAILTIAGVAGDKYGSAVACPAFEYCG